MAEELTVGRITFTPGPWVVSRPALRGGAYCVLSERDGDAAVALVYGRSQTDANAALIAAAPDLLAACRAALHDRMFKDWPEIATLLRDAIAKAEGREP